MKLPTDWKFQYGCDINNSEDSKETARKKIMLKLKDKECSDFYERIINYRGQMRLDIFAR